MSRGNLFDKINYKEYTYQVMKEFKGINFIAQVQEVKSKKTMSQDIEYKLTLITDDPTILSLGLIQAQTNVVVTVSME
jgi:hypothetical protein